MSASQSPTPADAFELLLAGNRRFVAGDAERPNQDAARRTELTRGQRPFAVVFECSDSRVGAEIVFDRGLGDLFVVRNAGHVLSAEALGSIEYGVELLNCPLVAVVGHESCGAVGAACAALDGEPTPGGYIRDLVERVTPSVLAARASGRTTYGDAVAEHVRRTVELLVDRSRLVAERVDAGQVAVTGLCYGLTSGQVTAVPARP